MKDLHSDDNEDESDEADENDSDSELEQPVNARGGSRSRRWVSCDCKKHGGQDVVLVSNEVRSDVLKLAENSHSLLKVYECKSSLF